MAMPCTHANFEPYFKLLMKYFKLLMKTQFPFKKKRIFKLCNKYGKTASCKQRFKLALINKLSNLLGVSIFPVDI